VNAPALVEHLRGLRVDLSISPMGKLHVEAPTGTLTDGLRSDLVEHRDELIAVLAAAATPLPQPLDWPPPEPVWFAAWMREDDARRTRTMAAAMQRRADHKRGQGAA
jgi:hypothetical protein